MSKLLKGLQETKNTKIAEVEEMLTRAAEEVDFEKVDELKREIEEINIKIETIKGADVVMNKEVIREEKVVEVKETEETRAMEEVRALEQDFLDYVVGKKQIHEVRAMDKSNTGAVIPTTIANDIVKEILVQSPAIAQCKHFNLGGTLTFVVEDRATGKIRANYVDEGQAVVASEAKFKTVSLTGFVIGAETIISRSLMNNSQFNLRSYVVEQLALAFAEMLEAEIFEGTAKIKGVATIADNRKVKLVKDTAITADHIIDLECKIPTKLRGGAAFYMHTETLKGIRKLKYTDGTYMIQRDFKDASAMTLCGRPVYETEAVPTNKIYFADMTGMYMKDTQNLSLQMLNEVYAERNCSAVIGFCECDAKPVEMSKLACLEIALA